MFDLIRDIAQGCVTVGAKVASNTTETVRKVATDTRTAVTKIAGDSASTARKVAGDIASTGTKIVGDLVSTFAKVGSDVAGTGIKIAKDVGDTANQILLGENITSILDNVLYDGLGTGVRIVTDCVGTLAKTTGGRGRHPSEGVIRLVQYCL
ncbi:hypothetical protein FSOLCH5_015229 [Fusarium solani]